MTADTERPVLPSLPDGVEPLHIPLGSRIGLTCASALTGLIGGSALGSVVSKCLGGG